MTELEKDLKSAVVHGMGSIYYMLPDLPILFGKQLTTVCLWMQVRQTIISHIRISSCYSVLVDIVC